MFVSVVSAAIVFPVTIFVILVFRTSNSNKSDGNDIAPTDSDDYSDNYNDVKEANRDLDDMSVILGEMNSNKPGWSKFMSLFSGVQGSVTRSNAP